MMSTIDLIILGILIESTMNAYDITQYIRDRQVGTFLKISDPAIYKSCKRLLNAGFLDGNPIKEGNQPTKTIYSINPDGRSRFHGLMVFYSSNFSLWNIEFNAFMWHLEKLDKRQGLKMLRNLGDELREKETWFKCHLAELIPYVPFSASTILKQNTMLITTLIAWVDEVIEDYKSLRSTKGRKFDVSAVNRIHGKSDA